jgi:hypothetical protein
MVPLERFELPTLALRKPCSTPELQRPMGSRLGARFGPRGAQITPPVITGNIGIAQARRQPGPSAFLRQRNCAVRRRSSEFGLSSLSVCVTPGSSGGRSGLKIAGFGRGSDRGGGGAGGTLAAPVAT